METFIVSSKELSDFNITGGEQLILKDQRALKKSRQLCVILLFIKTKLFQSNIIESGANVMFAENKV